MDNNELNKSSLQEETNAAEENYSLSDDRRVKVLSPGALVAKRFFRNRHVPLFFCGRDYHPI